MTRKEVQYHVAVHCPGWCIARNWISARPKGRYDDPDALPCGLGQRVAHEPILTPSPRMSGQQDSMRRQG